MINKPLITVIIPVYNGDKYLQDCLNSVLRQTYQNLEVIIVDDGSTDDAGKICDEYALKDNRIVVVHQENKGVSNARNVALDMFKGEYLCFMDSDDVYLSDQAIELSYNTLIKYDADMSMFGLININGNERNINRLSVFSTKEKCLLGQDMLNTEKKLHVGLPIGSINVYLFSRNVFDNIRFPEGFIVEDNAILHRLLYNRKVAIMNYYLYGYRWNKSSQMNNSDSVFMYKSIYNAFSDRINFYKEKGELTLARKASITMMNALRYRMIFVYDEGRMKEIPKEMLLPAEELIKIIKRKEKVLLSVIVPVYQVEKFLPACIDSILTQTLDDFELILVDDGSTDDSGKICDEYASKDKRIIVIHQDNKGLSAARNTGLKNARGKYVTMIDSDDVLLTDDYFKFLYESLIENKAQASGCTLRGVREDEVIEKEKYKERKDFIVTTGVGYWRCAKPNGFFDGCAFAKMYEKNLFHGLEYPVGRFVEDNAIIHRVMFPCERISILDMPMYGYRSRKGSIMNSTKKELMIRDVIYAFNDRYHYFMEQGHPELARWSNILMYYHINIYR